MTGKVKLKDHLLDNFEAVASVINIDVLSLAREPTEMMVTWVTLAYTNYTIVEYNKAGFPLTLRASGGVTKFTDGGSEHRVLYIHRVKLTGLVPGQRYGM